MKRTFLLFNFVLLTLIFHSCKEQTTIKPEVGEQSQTSNTEMALTVMQKHLDAVANRDLKTLESTLSPDGDMLLILPGTEIIEKTSGFLDNQSEWFETDNWTFDTKILYKEVGETIASIVVEAIYKEADRDGKPYFNRMHISYVLKKLNGDWFVIRDHMVSVQKSTDII